MQIHLETLTAPVDDSYGIPRQTVEVTIGTDRRAVACYDQEKTINIYSLAVRFSKGSKVWPGSAVYWKGSGKIGNLSPSIDRSGSFSLVGFIEDFEGKPVKSAHNAV